MRRVLTLIITLSMALVIYGALIALIIVRIKRMMMVTFVRGTPRNAAPSLISIADGQLDVFGHTVPLIAVIGAAAVPPLWWIAAKVYDGNLRRTRERHGECLECGLRLSGKRGRCPRCHTYFEQRLTVQALSAACR